MIEAVNLRKVLGENPILEQASFSVPAGSTVGLLGPNGAGKTTTIRLLAGSLAPTSGRATIGGIDVGSRPEEVRKIIGYLPEVPPLYPEMRVGEYLRFVATLRSIPRARISSAIAETVELCSLETVMQRLCGQLSRGFKQRVGIAQAILHKPPVLLLDEPTNGLDPMQTIEFRNLLRRFQARHTILLSTHLLVEVEECCSQAVFFAEGKTVGQFPIDSSIGRKRLEEIYFEVVAGHAVPADPAQRKVSNI